jgi:NurA-like 5'-3' nuclease
MIKRTRRLRQARNQELTAVPNKDNMALLHKGNTELSPSRVVMAKLQEVMANNTADRGSNKVDMASRVVMVSHSSREAMVSSKVVMVNLRAVMGDHHRDSLDQDIHLNRRAAMELPLPHAINEVWFEVAVRSSRRSSLA